MRIISLIVIIGFLIIFAIHPWLLAPKYMKSNYSTDSFKHVRDSICKEEGRDPNTVPYWYHGWWYEMD